MVMESKSKILFNPQTRVAPLGFIAMNGTQELAAKIDKYLVSWGTQAGTDNVDSYLIDVGCPRFASGDGKGIIKSTVRGKDLFIIVDTGNYNCTYTMFGKENAMSPDDHYQDLKRIIQAAGGKANRINVIMPMLYGGRQHRRSYRESLDCAVALQNLKQWEFQTLLLLTLTIQEFRTLFRLWALTTSSLLIRF